VNGNAARRAVEESATLVEEALAVFKSDASEANAIALATSVRNYNEKRWGCRTDRQRLLESSEYGRMLQFYTKEEVAQMM
jgi:hypothetical protein